MNFMLIMLFKNTKCVSPDYQEFLTNEISVMYK